MDKIQPEQPKQPMQPDQVASQPEKPVTAPQPISPQDTGMSTLPRRRTPLRWIIGGLIGLVLVLMVATVVAYQAALRPVDSANTTAQTVEIASGSTPSQISTTLKEASLIRSEFAFSLYTRLHGVQNSLQAGTYKLSQSQSTQDVVTALTGGAATQEVEVTFLPGATLRDHRTVLIEAGFGEAEVDEALTASYDHPLFASRPASADLEGYIYGETHRFAADVSVGQILTQYFDDFYAVIQENDLVERYKAQDLSLYEGITLASIVQKEVSGEGDSRQVAQVFYTRLAQDMPLGADATFVYAAHKAGETPRVDYPSPYNTRIHGGLPPGPISSPGLEALLAAADPAAGDYLYFVSGDDGKNYFSKTEEEHIRNTREHCQENCALF